MEQQLGIHFQMPKKNVYRFKSLSGQRDTMLKYLIILFILLYCYIFFTNRFILLLF